MLKKVIRRKPKEPRVFAFIDNQNLNLGVQKMGWKMDWRKLRAFLESEYGVKQAFMFIGYMAEHEDIYKQMHEAGYNVILKPTVGMFNTAEENKEQDNTPKGNVDVDLVLEAMKQWNKYDKAIIISGDGDFFALVEHLEQKGKLGNILVPNYKYSSLLKPYEESIVRVDKLRGKLAYKDYRRKRGGNKSNNRGNSKDQSKNQSNNRNKPKGRSNESQSKRPHQRTNR